MLQSFPMFLQVVGSAGPGKKHKNISGSLAPLIGGTGVGNRTRAFFSGWFRYLFSVTGVANKTRAFFWLHSALVFGANVSGRLGL